MPRRRQPTHERGLPTVHHAPNRRAAKPSAEGFEFVDQGIQHGEGVQKIDGDEMIGGQHTPALQILLNPIAEQATGKGPADPARHHDSGVTHRPHRPNLAHEAQPSGQG